ncbi:hypothetical protein IT411_03410 [Candidatus Peregrinibacteria bacterium]|nr:hypothetical protein [Candidatus Peregrinibacteria bacterium]
MQKEARKLVLLQGGQPGQVTHRPKGRCGSAKSRGGKYLTRSDKQAASCDAEIIQFQRYGYEHEDLRADPTITTEGDVAPVEQATGGVQVSVPEPEKPYIWSEADFTEKALAQHPKQVHSTTQAVESFLYRRKAEELSHRRTIDRLTRPGANTPGVMKSSHYGGKAGGRGVGSKQKR